MKKLEIKNMESIDYDIFNFPENIDNFNMLITMSIGFSGESEADNFGVRVCSTKWLMENIHTPEYMKFTIIVKNFFLDEFIDSINEILKKCLDTNENLTMKRLSHYFQWEFENYVELNS